MADLKISIIIPIYNGLRNHIEDALNSIYQQGLPFEKFEVICVDDCSTDNTVDFLNNYKIECPNLTILKTVENIRQGGARNLGINNAKGEYVMFLDQDDYYAKNSLREVLNHLESSNIEVLVCDAAWQIRGKEAYVLQHDYKFQEIMPGEEFLIKNGIPHAPWKYVIRKQMFLEHNLNFTPKVRIEDADWALKLTYYTKKMQYKPLLLVHYNRGAGSTTWDSYKDFSTIKDVIKMSRRIINLNHNELIESDIATKKKIEHIAYSVLIHGIKTMNAVTLHISEKNNILKNNLDIIRIQNKHNNNILNYILLNHTLLFCYTTSIIAPFYHPIIKICRLFSFR